MDTGHEGEMTIDETAAAQPRVESKGPPEALVKSGPENRPTLATELLGAEAGDVQAGVVAMERSGAEHVSGQRVVITNSGARSVDARSAQIDRSGVLALNAEKAVLYNSSAVAVAAEHVRLVRGRALMLKADHAAIEGDVRIGIYAGPVSETVRPLLDARGAAAFAASFGAVCVLLASLIRRAWR
jgi:hypothetical protein